MELKLQQAIVATRAGRTDVAQSLLTKLLQENPDDANAWFLLGHIVESPERQARYLQKTIELEPENVIAKKRLVDIENGPVPAPVIHEQPSAEAAVDAAEEETEVEQTLDATVPGTITVAELARRSQSQSQARSGNAQIDSATWQQTAGQPVRETREAPAPEAAATTEVVQSSTEPAKEKTSSEVWLVRILVLMVIIAAIVLGILVLLILV